MKEIRVSLFMYNNSGTGSQDLILEGFRIIIVHKINYFVVLHAYKVSCSK